MLIRSSCAFQVASLIALSLVPLKTRAENLEIAEAQISLIGNTTVAAPIAGVIAEVRVAEGDRVESGQVLVQLDDGQAQSEWQAAMAALEAAKLESENDVDARYAKRTLEVRQRELDQSRQANEAFPGAISATEIDKLRLVVDQSQLAIEQAEHQLQVARAKVTEKHATVNIAEASVKRHRLRSPAHGSVVEVAAQPGEWVDAGKPVVRVISLGPIRVECFVDGRQYGPALIGCKVEFERGTGDDLTRLSGQVTFVSPELSPVTGQTRLWATIENPGAKVRAGMRGKLTIELSQPDEPDDENADDEQANDEQADSRD